MENLKFWVKLRKNDFKVSPVNDLNELLDIPFENGESICPDDGKNTWYTYQEFIEKLNIENTGPGGETHEPIEEPIENEEGSSEPNPSPPDEPFDPELPENPDTKINDTSDRKSESNALIPVENGENEDLVTPSNPKPVEPPNNWIIFMIGGLVLAIALFWSIKPNFFKNEESSRVDKSQISGVTNTIQKKANRLLLEGDSLALGENGGNATEALKKFSDVRNYMDSDKTLDKTLVKKYIDKYNDKGDSLCEQSQEQVIQDMAQDFYLYAAKLSNTNPRKCK
jgi:hypothetical protein